MRKITFVFIILSLIFTISCKKDDPEITDNKEDNTDTIDYSVPASINHINIESAKVLLLLSDSDIVKLYMINSNDELELVDITTDLDTSFYLENEIKTCFDINDDYFALKTYDGEKRNYIIDKSTGDAYSIDDIGSMEMSYYNQHGDFSEEIVTSDENGFVYFVEEDNNQILRLDISDLNNISSEVASYEEDYVYGFTVDKEGNVVYGASFTGESILRAVSYDKTTVRQLPGSANSSWNYRFRGTDGYIYYDYDRMSTIRFNPYEVTQYANEYVNSGCGYVLLRVNNKKVNVAIGGCTTVAQISNIDSTIINIPYSVWDISEIIISKANDDFYYIAYKNRSGNIILNKVDPQDHIPEDIITSRYEVNDFDVTSDNTVYFKAFDNEGIKSVLGKVDASGVISVIEQDFKNSIVFLAITNL